jgi:hypothetical protein
VTTGQLKPSRLSQDTVTRGRVMERYLKVDRLIEKVWVVHSKPQVKAQRAIIASVSRADLQSTEIRSNHMKLNS